MNTTTNQATGQQAKHTPGPWTVNCDPDTNGVYIIREIRAAESAIETRADALIEDDPRAADTLFEQQGDLRLANARLIAAAPELLAELKRIAHEIKTNRPNLQTLQLWAECAIAKAEDQPA